MEGLLAGPPPVVGWPGQPGGHAAPQPATKEHTPTKHMTFQEAQRALCARLRLARWQAGVHARRATPPAALPGPPPSAAPATPAATHWHATLHPTTTLLPPAGQQHAAQGRERVVGRGRGRGSVRPPRRTSHSSSTSSCTSEAVCSISLISASRRCRSVMSLRAAGAAREGVWMGAAGAHRRGGAPATCGARTAGSPRRAHSGAASSHAERPT